MVREQREQHKQDLAYHARPFVLCGLPLRQPPADQLIYTRRKGRFSLEVAAHPRFGLPYGQDRLIPIWVTTLAVKHESRAIHFESAAQILEFFRLPKDGPHYRRMVQGFQRVFAATIFFGTDQRPEKAAVIDMARFHSFDRMHLWLNNRKEAHVPAHESFENEIVLSEAFYREIDEHRIPVEREAIAALARAPGVLDFYMWLVWKSWSVKGRPASVPLVSPNGLSEQMGSAENAQPRLFRYKIKTWLRQVKALWPERPATISPTGDAILVQSSQRNPAITAARKAVKTL